MPHYTRSFLCFAASLLLAATCVGQQSKRPRRGAVEPRRRPAPQREGEISFPTVVTKGGVVLPDEVRQVGQVEIRYYRKQDKTIVAAGGEVYRKPPVWIGLHVSFEAGGKVIARPEAVTVAASSNG